MISARRRKPAAFLAMAGVAAALQPDPVAAQATDQIRDIFRDAARKAQVGEAAQALTGFSALPGVSAARFLIDDDSDGASDSKATKLLLPLAHEVEDIGPPGLSLHTELTLGYLELDQDIGDVASGTILETSFDTRSQVFSAIGGLGVGYALGCCTTLKPMALIGYSRIEQDTDFSGPGAALLDAATDGILFNYTMDLALLGGAVEIADRRPLPHDLRFTGNLRYNHLYARAFRASDPVLETSSHFGVITGLAQLDGPTGAQAFGRDLRWIGFATHSSFPGNSDRALGFDYLFELGGGVEIVDREVVEGIEGLSLRASVLGGNGVIGWSAGFKLQF